MSERIMVRLSSEALTRLRQQAVKEGKPTATMAKHIIEEGIELKDLLISVNRLAQQISDVEERNVDRLRQVGEHIIKQLFTKTGEFTKIILSSIPQGKRVS